MNKDKLIQKECYRHGMTEYVLEKRGSYRCKKCRTCNVQKRRKVVKSLLVQDAGGKCSLCGYDKCQEALQFHHIDPKTKEFGIAEKGHSLAFDRMLVESKKCILLCANCHAEVEWNVTKVEIH
jgi:5-methylcytosine-specific restriction endonuclease McrA